MKYDIRERAADTVIYLLLILLGITTLYPFLNVAAIAFNDSMDTVKGGIYLLPRAFTFRNFGEIFQNPNLATAFKISIFRTALGAPLSVFCSAMLAYTLSRKDFMAAKAFSTLVIITMYISGGMIPSYLLILKLHLNNNFLVYIIPLLLNAFNVFVIKSFMEGLPISLQESAKIDGANDLVIFVRIIFPLCMPVIATVALFCAVGQWNSWFDTFLYASSNENLTTLQYELMKVLNSSSTAAAQAAWKSNDTRKLASFVSPESIRMAITLVATVPILLVYPFLQMYFVKGLTLGAVKS